MGYCCLSFLVALIYCLLMSDSWVQSQLRDHPDELWEDGIMDYLRQASDILVQLSLFLFDCLVFISCVGKLGRITNGYIR